MAVEGRGASLLEDFRNLQPDRPEFPVLDAEADLTLPGALGLRLLRPFHGDPKDSFSGLTHEHTRGHMVRCIMEAVAFRLEEHLTRLCGEDLPLSLLCCGGATRSRGWLQIKADVLNIACAPPACPEPACLGGALLAGYGMGWNTSQDWPCHITDANLIQPRPQVHEIYQAQKR
jgi:sugar (pentulose or hexulose) kinase